MYQDDPLSLDLDFDLPLPRATPFTTAMARDHGFDPRRLSELCQAGVVRRALRGVYVDASLPDSLELRAACLRLVMPDDAVVVDRHAGWLLGAQMVLAPHESLESRPLSVFRLAGRGRLEHSVAAGGERMLTEDDIVELAGLRVTTPIRTAWDLGRVPWPDQAIAGLDAMFRLRAFTREVFLEGVERFRGHRWVTTLRAVAPLADGRSESPGESVLHLRCYENGLQMTPQVEVREVGHVVARLDLANEELGIAAEYDGVEWHSSPEQVAHDRRRRADLAERGWDIEALGKDLVFGRARNCDAVLRGLWHRGQVRLKQRAA